MAVSGAVVEDPRPVRRSWNHPSHVHMLTKVDTREVYGGYGSLWRCDLCKREFKHQQDTLLLSTATDQEEREALDHTHSHHCGQCVFDVCSQCFNGHLHPFHTHRLKRAKPDLVYLDTEGQWKCDACQRVFVQQLGREPCYHCTDCEVDLCERCFIGEWGHTLHEHSNHLLKPVDPRLEYRTFLSWLCDNCERRFTFEDAELMYHCSTCQFDLCTQCFKGRKHHLHQHGLVEVSRHTYGAKTCSHCGKYTTELVYHQCTRPTCNFTLCTACHVIPPRLHPCHAHPLSLCDPMEVYPQSGGLWHCDVCTLMHPSGEQTPLPPSQPMYHCEQCDFDLCQECYSNNRGGTTSIYGNTNTGGSSGNYSNTTIGGSAGIYGNTTIGGSAGIYGNTTIGGSSRKASEMVLPPRPQLGGRPSGESRPPPVSYVTRPDSLSSLSPPLSFIPSHPRDFSLQTCSICDSATATKYFIHGHRTCSEWPIACQTCAERVLRYSKPCPHCGVVPASISNSAMY